MSLFSVSNPISSIAKVADTILTRVLPDPAAAAAGRLELAKMSLNGELQQVADQIQVDNTEADSKSVFVAGWRPFIGWTCGAGLAYEFMLRPLLTFTVLIFHGTFVAPELDMSSLNQLLFGMLGLASMRTVEKIKGVQAGH